MVFQKETLILGGGRCAAQVAQRLSAHGIAVRRCPLGSAGSGATITTSGERPERVSHDLSLADCRGQAGDFVVTLTDQQKRIPCKVGSIVIAQDCVRHSNHDLYGLSLSERIMTISALVDTLEKTLLKSMVSSKTNVVFLNSWRVEPHPVMAQVMLQRCLEIQTQQDVNTFFLCGNLKVSADGMEACYEEAKNAGTVFLKFAQRYPVLTSLADGRVQIDYWDETTRMDYRLVADWVIVDEQIAPHPWLIPAIQRLRLEADAFGFAQSDNVHRLPNSTNRRGIFAAGGARAVLSEEAQDADADQAALKVLEFLSDLDRAPLPLVEIDQGRCARCLTCYRYCPYAAIETEPRMTINPAACQSCGICVAGCPNRAIQIGDEQLDKALRHLAGQGGVGKHSPAFEPKIVIFCCTRSAVPARDWAISMGHALPAGLLFVEGVCGGTFSVHHLLSAIEAGMDGILVLTCHEGNCHSERGTLEARKRVAETMRLLSWTGITADRVSFTTLAANMGSEFAQFVNGFAEKIKALGPAVEKKAGPSSK